MYEYKYVEFVNKDEKYINETIKSYVRCGYCVEGHSCGITENDTMSTFLFKKVKNE